MQNWLHQLPPTLDVIPMLVRRHALGSGENVADLNWPIVPYIDTHIHRISSAAPRAVDVAENLNRTLSRSIPRDHRIMAECHHRLSIRELRQL